MNKPIPHKHVEVIKAWADGHEIECRNLDISPIWSHTAPTPTWRPDLEYRVKPQTKEVWINFYPTTGFSSKEEADIAAGRQRVACVKVTYTEGEGV